MSITVPPAALAPAWSSSSRPAPSRAHRGDALATFASGRSGRTAFAVADGVGDIPEAARAARLVAAHAVRVAALEGRAEAGIAAAGQVLRGAGPDHGDAALVVALAPGGGTRDWEIAWVGDCRALSHDGDRTRTVTRDHTMAGVLRALRMAAGPPLDRVLMTSVRSARRSEIGVTRVPATTSLVLVSDGVHRALDARGIGRVLAGVTDPRDGAEYLTAAARRAGAADDVTALVVAPPAA